MKNRLLEGYPLEIFPFGDPDYVNITQELLKELWPCAKPTSIKGSVIVQSTAEDNYFHNLWMSSE